MKIKFALFVSLFWAGTAAADVITLTDGSRIQGEVLSMSDGQYQVHTASLGTVSVPKNRVRSIESQTGMGSSPGTGALESLQSTMTSDQGVMSMILQLQSDPDMQAVLSDPELMRAVQSFDFETLRTHPKIQKLMQNQKVQAIHDRVQ